MTTEYGCTELSAMKAAFPARPTPLEGRPELRGLLVYLKHLMTCAMSHRTHGLPLGKLYLVVGQNTYSLFTAEAYPAREPDPGQTPSYQPADNVIARTIILNQFKVDYKRHHDENTMDAALIKRLHSMLDPEYAQTLQESMVNVANATFKATFEEAV